LEVLGNTKKEKSTIEAQRTEKESMEFMRNGAESVRLDVPEPFAGNEISLGVSAATSVEASLS